MDFFEEYVDSSNIIEGQRVTLYTAVGQPFTAKMAVVNLDTPYFKGHPTVGLVAYLAADALLGPSFDSNLLFKTLFS
jgi:hypothetical protein